MMETITVTRSSFNGGPQNSKLNITEQQPQPPLPYEMQPKPYANKETTFSSAYLNPTQTSQTIPGRQITLQNPVLDDNDLSIFDAQKYFNEGNEHFQSRHHNNKLTPDQYEDYPRFSSVSSSIDAYSASNYRARSFHATPTASSEASWNSQTGLLSNPPGTIKVSLRKLKPILDEKKRTTGSSNTPRWFFGRNCPCTGKKSLQVDDKTVSSEARSPIHFRATSTTATITTATTPSSLSISKLPKDEIQTPAGKSNTPISTTKFSPEKEHFASSKQPPLRISVTARKTFSEGTSFSFPILKPSPTKINGDDPPRDSLEVFHPPNLEIEAKKKMMTSLIEDDAASDGSSDLFEIESFSTQTTYQMYNNGNSMNTFSGLRRESLDEASNFQNPRRLNIINSGGYYRRNSLEEPATPSVAPTEGYEPSEASIDWSVTTAEGFDRASVATYDDVLAAVDGGISGGRRNSGGGGSRGSGLLGLGCRSEKAVLVGPNPQRVGPSMVGLMPMPIPQHVDGWTYNKPPLASRPIQAHR